GVPTSPVAPVRSAMMPILIGSSESASPPPPSSPPHADRTSAVEAARATAALRDFPNISFSFIGLLLKRGYVVGTGARTGQVGEWLVAERPEPEVVLHPLPDAVQSSWLEDQERDDDDAEGGITDG